MPALPGIARSGGPGEILFASEDTSELQWPPPMKKLMLGSFLAALAVFFFGAAFWMSPPTMKVFGTATQPDSFAKNLLDQLPATGAYLYPGPRARRRKSMPPRGRVPSPSSTTNGKEDRPWIRPN